MPRGHLGQEPGAPSLNGRDNSPGINTNFITEFKAQKYHSHGGIFHPSLLLPSWNILRVSLNHVDIRARKLQNQPKHQLKRYFTISSHYNTFPKPPSGLVKSPHILIMPLALQAIALMARDIADSNNVLKDKSLGPSATIRLVAAITTSGWITFGLIIGLVLNTRGKASSFVPEWYLDSNGSAWAKLAVAAWWVFIILFWPAVCAVYVIFAAGRAIRSQFPNSGGNGKENKERERETSEVALV
ncbi:hypothetical protein FGADI_8319 [Fusarium gaditjirri]|uniref:Uncharacterized protein n=1 Tax=Fusarium gaditjirri TaxID=282569 RepID=A0A8H4WTK9_9HYPO|nr:hypothetical protein FGADI_8319 [Fusarium gaditjirri]